MTSDLPSLLGTARRWLAEDPDPQTRRELAGLVSAAEGDDAEARADLVERFGARLEFGTAGLRGALGAGPHRMNRVVVVQAAAGLAAYLRAHGQGGGRVVVGYDARHKSRVFAHDTADVLAGAGLVPLVLPRPLPTPVVAYAIRDLDGVAGVMVTASHNPPQDNGYKVYLGDGSQIVPPADAEISEAIRTVAAGSLDDVPRSPDWELLDESVVGRYADRVAGLVAPHGPRELSFVYTPLHGVGGPIVGQVLERTGFPAPIAVQAQAEPDPDFPTVAFPNPEEPGALDLAYARADETGATLIVANDPDADRCAVAVPTADGWRRLTGDEVGALLALHLLRSGVRGTFATTIVSSSLLSRIAERHDLAYVETLTGFKWLGRIPDLAYGYEEALGYCVDPEAVRDKDGIAALLRLVELAAALRAEGRTMLDELDAIALAYGVCATEQLSVPVHDIADTAGVLSRLATHPPAELGGRAVEQVDDLSAPTDELPPTEGVRYRLARAARLVVRPSGTEPKLKCYLEVVVPVEGGDVADVAIARGVARNEMAALRTDLEALLGPGTTG